MSTDRSCQQRKMPGLGERMLKGIVIFMVIAIGVTEADDPLTSSDHVRTQIEPSAEISSKFRPYIQSPASHLQVLVGKTVEFPCKVHDLGHFVLTWRRGRTGILFSGTIRVDRDERFSLVNGTSLRIYSVTPEFSGSYVCQVRTQPPIELHHNLQVLVPPSIVSVPADGMVVVKKDESIHLNCSTGGDPTPVITWKAAKGNLPGGITEKQGNTLIIPSAESFHSGLYECKAENGVGNPATQTFKVEVLYEPHVSVSPTWVHFGKGATVEFNCTVSAEPTATVYWSHLNGSTLHSDNEHTSITSMPNLSILQIKWIDDESFGSYVCYANNTIGFDSKTVEISGLAEPVTFKTNPVGSENSSFFLKWSIKSYSPIFEYQLSVRTLQEPMDSAGEWVPVMIPVMTQQNILYSQSYNITGLTPGKGYEVVIQARNVFGWNYPSNSFIFYTHGREVQQNGEDETESNTTMSDLRSSSLEEKTGEPEEKVNASKNKAWKQTFPKYILFMFIFSLSFLLL